MRRMMLTAAAMLCLGAAGTANAEGGWRYTDFTAPAAAENDRAMEMNQKAPDTGISPANFMTMAAVVNKFGEPDNRAPEVGKPPIARWYYSSYTVYFEYERVIISVFN